MGIRSRKESGLNIERSLICLKPTYQTTLESSLIAILIYTVKDSIVYEGQNERDSLILFTLISISTRGKSSKIFSQPL